MSQPFPGFVGPSYNFVSKMASVERCVNWYLIPNESTTESKFTAILAPSPGNAAFSTLPVPAPYNQPNRGLIEQRGRLFGVNGNQVFRLDETGHYHPIGIVANDGKPVCMVANGNSQIFIASAGAGYIIEPGGLDLSLQPLDIGEFLGSSYATFQDGYFLVIRPNSNVFQVSGTDDVPLGDGTQWSSANVSAQAGQADELRAIISSREYIHLMGDRRSQIYVNVGNQGVGNFPFSNYNSTFIETGIAAPFSLVELGDSIAWIGLDARGVRALWHDASFQPQRASNFAVEQQWAKYARIDDAVAFSFTWNGHLMYQVTFPSAFPNDPPDGFPLAPPSATTYTGATWVYDVTASALMGRPVWHERSYQTAAGFAMQRSESYHAYCYGKHLVGSTGVDGNPGAIYQYDDGPAGFSDCGTDIDGTQMVRPIVRDRITPHAWQNNKLIVYNRLEFELERGVGLDGGVFGSDPQILVRWSNDGGKTWGAERNVSAGKIGEYSKRVFITGMGSARDRVYWVRCTDPVYWSFINAMLDIFECVN